MKTFKQFKFHPDIMSGIEEAGFTEPTPIQTQAIPAANERKDILGLAQTGTGKTAAFVLPILQHLWKEAPAEAPEEGNGYAKRRAALAEKRDIKALIVAPTRELAEQIQETIEILGKFTSLRSTTVYGGVRINAQINRLKAGVDIVVACPGRLLDHLQQKTIDLRKLEILVLDEADQMFDMGFLVDIRRLIKQLPVDRQNLLFSATMPKEIRTLAAEILVNPETVEVGNTAPPVTVSHAIYPVTEHLKTALLFALLEKTDTNSVLIFTRTKHRAKRIGEQLIRKGYKAASLQGNLSQNRRQEALNGFRSGTYQILVATDIAARGIDVSQISHVINYDMPNTPEAYVHRIGRTGRAAKTGDAYTFVTSEDGYMVKTIERKLGTVLERRNLEDFDYKAAKQSGDEFARAPGPRQGARPHSRPDHRSDRGDRHGSSDARPHRTGATRSTSGQERSYGHSSERGENRPYRPRENDARQDRRPAAAHREGSGDRPGSSASFRSHGNSAGSGGRNSRFGDKPRESRSSDRSPARRDDQPSRYEKRDSQTSRPAASGSEKPKSRFGRFFGRK